MLDSLKRLLTRHQGDGVDVLKSTTIYLFRCRCHKTGSGCWGYVQVFGNASGDGLSLKRCDGEVVEMETVRLSQGTPI